MRWYKHLSASHDDDKLAELLAVAGLEGYGAWWLLLELIATNMDGDKIDCTCLRLPESLWSKHFGISAKKFRKFADFTKNLNLIILEYDPPYITIDVPNLLKYRDEWTTRKSARTRVTPEPLPSGSVCSDLLCSSSLSYSEEATREQTKLDIKGKDAAPKRAAKATRKPKAKAKGDGKDDENKFFTRIIQTCSEVRYNSKNDKVRHTTINPHDKKNRWIASEIHTHVVEQFRLRGKPLDTETELKYIGRLYEHFLLYEKRNLDAEDYIVDSNYSFIAFKTHLDEWIAAVNRDDERSRVSSGDEPKPPAGKPKFTDPAEARREMDKMIAQHLGKMDAGDAKADDKPGGKDGHGNS